MIKLVAFDWNGTIFSDTSATLEGVNEVFKFFKSPPIGLKTFQKHFDVPVRNSYIAMGMPSQDLDKKSKEIARVFHTSYEKRSIKIRTRAFVGRLLSWLSENHIESLIFSNHIDEPIKKQLKRLRIEKYFEAVLANSSLETAFRGRAKHEKLKSYIKGHNLSVKEVLTVGDTVEEIEIGKELGCYTVAVTHGFCSTSRLKAAKPDFLISNLKEVIDIIKKL